MLADISLKTEFRIHEITMLLLWIYGLSKSALSFGRDKEPSMLPNLFLTDKAIFIDRLHEA